MLERVGGVLARSASSSAITTSAGTDAATPIASRATAIPLGARIICACDAYSAMTTNRPYRAALPLADAVAELERCSDSQFDPHVVVALMRTVARHPEHRPARTLLELAA